MVRKMNSTKNTTIKKAEEYFYVEKIMDHRIIGNILEVSVRWANDSETTWEPEREIRKNASMACDLYFNKLTKAQLKNIENRTGRKISFNIEAYEVEKVMNLQRDPSTGELRAHVLWVGYPTEPTWENALDVRCWAREALEAYVNQLSAKDKEVYRSGIGQFSVKPNQLKVNFYEVDRVIGLRKSGGQKEAKIEWTGSPSSDNSWEPLEYVKDTAKEAYKEYYNSLTEKEKKELGKDFEPSTPAPQPLPSHVASLFQNDARAQSSRETRSLRTRSHV